MKKLQRGIIKIRVCSQCPDRIPVEVKRGKRKLTACSLDVNCPDKKKYGPDYYIRYKLDGKDVKEKVGPSLLMAKKALSSRKGEVAQGKFKLQELKPGMVFRDFAGKHYIEHVKRHKRSWVRDQLSIKHLVNYFGEMYLKQISAWQVEVYQKKRSKEINPLTKRVISPATVNRELACLKHCFNLAIKWGYADRNPVRGVKFHQEKRRERYLTVEEIERLLSVTSGKLRVIIITALFTGMRLNEILRLRWKNVDLRSGIITIEPSESKNNEVRYVPINTVLTEELMSIRIRDNEFVFSTPGGGHVKSIKDGFKKALQDAGIKDFRFHDLRHSFASHLAMKGIDPLTIKELGGWKTLAMVQRYAHLSNEHKKKAVEQLESVVKVENKWKTKKPDNISSL